jgi:hypothetical protein
MLYSGMSNATPDQVSVRATNVLTGEEETFFMECGRAFNERLRAVASHRWNVLESEVELPAYMMEDPAFNEDLRPACQPRGFSQQVVSG